MSRHDYLPPVFTSILNSLTPQVPEQPPAALVREECPYCNGTGTLHYFAPCCQVCAGKGYIVVESPL
jgi:DnaJ-class molecular chaperone